jgi:MFS family permease
LTINATYWIGAAIGSAATIVLLNGKFIAPTLGWRFAFGIGATLGLVIIFIRRYIPESPRWLMTHGDKENAEQVVREVEKEVREMTGTELPAPEARSAFACGFILRGTRFGRRWFIRTVRGRCWDYRSWRRRRFSTMRSFSRTRCC